MDDMTPDAGSEMPGMMNGGAAPGAAPPTAGSNGPAGGTLAPSPASGMHPNVGNKLMR